MNQLARFFSTLALALQATWRPPPTCTSRPRATTPGPASWSSRTRRGPTVRWRRWSARGTRSARSKPPGRCSSRSASASKAAQYAIREPLVFEPQDSGTEQCPITLPRRPRRAADHLRRPADHRLAEAGRPLGRASARGGGGPVDLRRAVGQRRAPNPGADAERGLFLYGRQGPADHRPEDRQTRLQRPRRVPLQAGRHPAVQQPGRSRRRRVPVLGGRPSADRVRGRGEACRHLPESRCRGRSTTGAATSATLSRTCPRPWMRPASGTWTARPACCRISPCPART